MYEEKYDDEQWAEDFYNEYYEDEENSYEYK